MYFLIVLVILFVIANSGYYFGIIPSITIKYVYLLIVLVSTFISGLFVGRKSLSKGYMEGVKIGIIIISALFLFSLFFSDNAFTLMKSLFYLIIMLSCVSGSIVGINKNQKEGK